MSFVTRAACPVCGSKEWPELFDCGYSSPPVADYLEEHYTRGVGIDFEYLHGARYTLQECTECALIFQQHVPGQDVLEQLYGHWIDPEASRERSRDWKLRHHVRLAEELMQILAAAGRKPSSVRVLDFGTGWGRWPLMAAALGCQATATELSAERVQHVRELGFGVLDWDETQSGASM